MKRFGLGNVLGVGVLLFALGSLLMSLVNANRRADRAAANIQLGMTVEQFVQNFPMDFDFGSIVVTGESEVPCISPEKSASPAKSTAVSAKAHKAKARRDTEKQVPDVNRIPFPNMKADDPVAVRLASEAARSPQTWERFLALDRHLADQKDYKTASELWTYYLQDHPTEARAYCERGGAYQHTHDFLEMYKDAKKSCGLGDDTCCNVLKMFPAANVESWERQASTETVQSAEVKEKTNRNEVPAKVCTAASRSARSLMVSRNSREDDKFKISFMSSNAPSEILSRSQLLELVNQEYKGHEWRATFTYLTVTPQHFSFRILIGPGGKVTQKEGPRGWD